MRPHCPTAAKAAAATDLLLLIDPSRALFLDGVADVGADVDEIGAFADDFATDKGYRRVIALGTSGGSLAAIHAAITSGWSKGIAVGPAVPSHHAGFADKLRTLRQERSQFDTALEIYTADVARDVDASNQIKHLFPSASVQIDKRIDNHNLLNELYEEGELAKFFASVLG